jgi:hypothetical protein
MGKIEDLVQEIVGGALASDLSRVFREAVRVMGE